MPVLLAYNVTISSNSSLSSTFSKPTESSSFSLSSNLLPVPTTISPTTTTATTMPSLVSGYHNISGETQRMCIADYGSEELHILYVVAYTIFVFVVPTTGVILNHLGKSLSQRANINNKVLSLHPFHSLFILTISHCNQKFVNYLAVLIYGKT